MRYIYLAIFLYFTSFHLLYSYRNDQERRNFSKGFIILSLLGFYLETASERSWFIILAIIFSWLGDLFLIKKGEKWLAFGGSSFLLSLVFLLLGYNEQIDFSNLNIFVIIGLALAFIVTVIIIFVKMEKNMPKVLAIPMVVYLLTHGAMNCFALYRMILNFNTGTVITAIGSLLFFVSDTALFFVRFNKESKQKSHFLVMLTYSLGELLIVLGLVIL